MKDSDKKTVRVKLELSLSRGTIALLRAIEKDRKYLRAHPLRIR